MEVETWLRPTYLHYVLFTCWPLNTGCKSSYVNSFITCGGSCANWVFEVVMVKQEGLVIGKFRLKKGKKWAGLFLMMMMRRTMWNQPNVLLCAHHDFNNRTTVAYQTASFLGKEGPCHVMSLATQVLFQKVILLFLTFIVLLRILEVEVKVGREQDMYPFYNDMIWNGKDMGAGEVECFLLLCVIFNNVV